jgi:hypothetical protein
MKYGRALIAVFNATLGTTFRPGCNPILNLTHARGIKDSQQRNFLGMLMSFNEEHSAHTQNQDSELSARMTSYELALRMPMAAPDATDQEGELEATKKLHGLDNAVSADFGGRCLVARRLVTCGVGFVQVWSGNGMNANEWDGCVACEKNHQAKAQTDLRVAGLLPDLKARGLFDSTLVIWGGKLRRPSTSDERPRGAEGRDHNPDGFTIWPPRTQFPAEGCCRRRGFEASLRV